MSNLFTSAVLVFLLLMMISVYTLGRNYFDNKLFSESEGKNNLIPVICLGFFTAIISAIPGAAKWQKFEINYDYNNFALIFTKYLPVILLIAILASVFILLIMKSFMNVTAEES